MSVESKISFYNSAKDLAPAKEITIREFVRAIREGDHAALVERVRSTGTDDEKRDAKMKLPAVQLSGRVTTGNRAQAMTEGRFAHSGWLQLDVDGDGLDGKTPEEARALLGSDKHVLTAFVSPSGKGAKALFRIPACSTDEEHKAAFKTAERYILEKYHLTIDPAPKNPGSLCYLSADTDSTWQPMAEEFIPSDKKPEPQKPADNKSTGFPEPPKGQGVNDWVIRAARYGEQRGWSESDTCAKIESYNGTLRRSFEAGEVQRAIRKVYDSPSPKAKPTRPLSSFLVNHAETLGMSWDEIDALRPPVIIEGFLRQGEVMLTGAESKSRKSWLVQDAGIAVAAGLPWLADEDGENGFATAQARVHVIDLELNPSEMRFRFAKARGNRFFENPEAAAEVTSRIAAYSFDGMNVRDILPLIEEMKVTVNPGDLVILDCLYRLVPDGNETAEVAAILETVKRFASDTQAGVIVVDHFRKAGDDKARNRFAGSFVKQASASTLVAIEAKPDDLLCLNIDARTFHGCPLVHARFNLETYAFNRVPEVDVEAAREGKSKAEAEGWIVKVWRSKPLSAAATNADAADKWNVTRQAASTRFSKLETAGIVTKASNEPGQAVKWILTPKGGEIIKTAINLHPSLHP